jgi:predicted NBD/HSP70 family sugar kinase
MQITGDQQLLKEINRMALVCRLCSHPGMSRADLAQALGLTKSTVSLLVSELIDQGWIVEHELLVTGGLGRRPTPLHINPERLVLLGADVGIENIRIVATSLTGQIIANTLIEYVDISDTKACIKALAKGFVEISKQVHTKGREIAGLGVGLPGGVDETAGVLHFAPNLGWRDVKVAALLSTYLSGTNLQGLPLFLQNEADVAALGELEFADQMGSDPLVYVSIGYGVGAGVVVNDRLLTGRNGFGGEVGHTILQLNGPLCSCGRRGCAETLIGFRSLLSDPTAPSTASATTKLQHIRARVMQGEPVAVDAAEKAGRYLGVLLQNLWAAYDPARIVLGGAAVDLGTAFLQPALQTFKSYASAAQLTPPLVQMSRFGENAVAVGAAGLVRYRLTRPLTSPTNSVSAMA